MLKASLPLSLAITYLLFLFVSLMVDIPTSMGWYFIAVLSCLFLITSDVEHLFLYLLASVSLLWKSTSLVPLCLFFFNQIFISFLLWIYMSSLYILNIDLLSDMWFANIFSYSVVRLFIPLFLLLCRSFLDWCNSTYLFLLLLLVLLMSHRKSRSDQCQGSLSLCFLLKVLHFHLV